MKSQKLIKTDYKVSGQICTGYILDHTPKNLTHLADPNATPGSPDQKCDIMLNTPIVFHGDDIVKSIQMKMHPEEYEEISSFAIVLDSSSNDRREMCVGYVCRKILWVRQ